MTHLYRIILFLSVFFIAIDAGYASVTEVSVIKSQDLPIYQQAYEGFKSVYTGKTREFDLKGDPDEAEKVVMAIKKDPPELILAIGLLAVRVARENFTQIPVIFCMVYDPARLSISGENITGVSLETYPSETFVRIKDFFPKAKRIGVLFDPKKTGRTVSQAISAAHKLGLSLITEEVHSAKLVPYSIRAIQNKIDLLWLIPDSTVVTAESLDFILLTALENNLPVISFTDDMVRRGAVMAISPDYRGVGEQAGHLAAEVLKGKKPGNMPVSFARRIRTLINPDAARKLGIKIKPESIYSLTYKIDLYSPSNNVRNIPENINPGDKIYE